MIAGIFLLDVVFIAVHLVWGQAHPAVNLEVEHNLPTYYSSFKLLCIAGMAAVSARIPPVTRVDNQRVAQGLWWVIAVLFCLLALDESLTLHESSARWLAEQPWMHGLRELIVGHDVGKSSFLWVVFFAPLICTAFYVLWVFVWQVLQPGLSVRGAAITGVVCFAAAVCLETVVFALPSLAAWTERSITLYRLATSVEESLELLGSSCLLLALWRHRHTPAAEPAKSRLAEVPGDQ